MFSDKISDLSVTVDTVDDARSRHGARFAARDRLAASEIDSDHERVQKNVPLRDDLAGYLTSLSD